MGESIVWSSLNNLKDKLLHVFSNNYLPPIFNNFLHLML
jgi:hypothetical protein